jgi:uncharacterized iron-regulated protein
MKNITKLIIIIFSLTLLSMKGDKPAYKLFDGKGGETTYKDLIRDASKSDIVFFGELHDNSICHWLEHEVTKDLFAEAGDDLILGAEMFETDNQFLLNEYLSGAVAEKNFEEEAKLWKNYKTDYRNLVIFAKDHDLPFIATNIPRRYAAVVNKKGFDGLDSLDPGARDLMAPLPIAFDPQVECYKSMMAMMRGMRNHDTLNIARAQAMKDATMAHFILKNWEKGKTFLHYNGSYHSDNHEGIVWWLKKENPGLKILTITTVEQDTISSVGEETIGKADYILVTPTNTIKTYSSTGGF